MTEETTTEYRALLDSVIKGDLPAIKQGIKDGFDPNSPDPYGFLLLHRACVNDQSEIVSFLIECGSDISRKATDDWTPLHCAAVAGAISCIEPLIEAGAMVNAPDKGGNTPLHLATIGDHGDLLILLLKHGGDPYRRNHKDKSVSEELFGDYTQTIKRDRNR